MATHRLVAMKEKVEAWLYNRLDKVGKRRIMIWKLVEAMCPRY